MSLRPAYLAAIAALAAGACSHSPPAAQARPAQPAPAQESEPLVGPAKARADSARYPYTQADIDFMSGMIHHHAQAIVMAKWAPTHGASESIRTLCARIINAQQDEILTMQNWLRDRNQPVPDATPGPMTMDMGGMKHEMLMPGMLTDEQMKELDAARGHRFDELFLRDMIQHHTGAVSMVKQLFGSYGAAQDELTFKLASDINVDQTTEIARMQRMLVALTFGSDSP